MGFPNLFEPIDIGPKRLKHRLNFGAHTANMSVEGLPGERHVAYYRERALGGAAMIVVEPVPVHRAAVFKRGCFRAGDDSVIPAFAKIVEACRPHGPVMVQQLLHIGAHGDYDNSYHANWSPSGFPGYHDSDGSHAMSEDEIEETIEAFVAAALRAQKSGFDGIEIFAAYNALVDQFWSPITNRRTDRWGGRLDNRTRFSTEITSRIRDRAGPDFVIGMAITGDDLMPGGLAVEQMAEIAAWHDERGLVDYISVGTGSYYDFAALIPTVLYPDNLGPTYSEVIKRSVRYLKVQAESHIRTPENADYVIASGQADMVSVVRGQIADPHMARKAMEDKAGDIRPCISCNQMCWGRRSRDYAISCLVNPSVGREGDWGGDRFEPAAQPKTVLVVGGGPAGLEAARAAAERGHRVTLAEASDRLGGQFRLAGLQPRRAQILDLIDWYARQLEHHQVKVLFNTPVGPEEVADFGADLVVAATGAQPAETGFQRMFPNRDRLPGIERGNVHSAEAVMSRAARPGERVLVLDEGGNWKGCGTAWHLAEQGHKVTLATPDPIVGKELQRTSADFPLRRKLKTLGTEMLINTCIGEWHGDAATLVDILDMSESRRPFDALVLATTPVAETWLADGLRAAGVPVVTVGDCVAPRHAPAATYEGRAAALAI